jgi:dolichyl-phosphate-mannose--protein O-mannosyl transferase
MSMDRLLRAWPIAAILTFALSIRLWRLSLPTGYIFDEVYYAENANSLLSSAVELDAQGQAEFVVHPPFGKWLIAIGIRFFGNEEFGWRFASAIFGTLSILLIYLIVKKLFNSEFLSITAALLMAFDGLNLVMSRVALLDIFLMFFILLSIYFLITNNLWLSGSAIGLAISIKWSAAFLIPLVILFVVIYNKVTFRNLYKVVSQFTLLPISIYFASWSGWIFSSQGWARQSESNVFASLWNYHLQILDFHQGLDDKHAYQANPWSWLVLGRPTSFYYESPSDCGAEKCAQEILAIGTPLLWWISIFAVAITFGFLVTKLERAAAIILLGFAGTYLPWFFIQSRTTFYFYSISILPFLILALIYCFNQLLNIANYKKYIISFVILVAINFIYFLPIYLGISIPYSQWLSRMWFESWI